MHELVLILDYGSQFTQLIARRLREVGCYAEVVPCTTATEEITRREPKALVLSGGPNSLAGGEKQYKADSGLFALGVPVLGICYGQQAMAEALGGTVAEGGNRREFGRASVKVLRDSPLFEGVWRTGESHEVWMSHGDKVQTLPQGFTPIAETGSAVAAMADESRQLYGVQFHPEVVHTPAGTELLRNFALRIAKLRGDWTMDSFAVESVAAIRGQVGGAGRVLCALSGGVDSAVTAALVHKAIGDRLVCVFVDTGLLRQGERQEVERLFAEGLGLPLRVVDASAQFLSVLDGISDSEDKRKRIGNTFIEVFEREVNQLRGVNSADIDSGTISSGDIHSGTADSATTDSGTISSGDMHSGTADSGTTDSDTISSGDMHSGTADSATTDSGTISSGDKHSGTADSATTDSGTVDSGTVDSGTVDSGTVDSGTTGSGDINSGSTNLGKTSPANIDSERTIANWFLAQGTLYPDVIESVSFHGGPSHTIKSHHNVGGLPERMKLALVEPLRTLFKDEVRALGALLGLPHEFLWRHPFPGPGLAIRIPGVVTADRVALLQQADAIFLEELRAANLYDQTWQAFAVLLPVRSVGVMGDARSYDEAIALRAVTATDGMTAEAAPLPHVFLNRVATRIVNEVRGINRVVYDITSKPPGTIEWE